MAISLSPTGLHEPASRLPSSLASPFIAHLIALDPRFRFSERTTYRDTAFSALVPFYGKEGMWVGDPLFIPKDVRLMMPKTSGTRTRPELGRTWTLTRRYNIRAVYSKTFRVV